MYNAVIFAAVSTPGQAGERYAPRRRKRARADEQDRPSDDKYSLDNQIDKSREVIASRGWREVHDPILIPGESRTELISLSDAAREIPEIGQLLDLARGGAVNLVVFYDFNRFRVLIQQIAYVLAAYGCQMYSVSQPVDPLTPERFAEQDSESSIIVRGIGSMMSELQIATIKRNFRAHMPRRVTELGLPWAAPRYGYRKPEGHDSKAIPVQVPEEVAVLQRMRRWFVEDGESANAIARRLTAEDILTPRGSQQWFAYTVLALLCSPFYAGFVYHGAERTRLDPMTRKRRREKTGRLVMARGKHAPIWSEDDWRAILERRAEVAQGNAGKTKLTHRFSRLVHCDRCGSLMRAVIAYRKQDNLTAYVCGGQDCAHHEYIREPALLPAVREAIDAMLHRSEFELPAGSNGGDVVDQRDVAEQEAKLRAIPARRARYQKLYADELMTYEEYVAHDAELKVEAEQAERELAILRDQGRRAARRAGRRSALAELLANYDQLAAGPDLYFNTRMAWSIAEIRVRDRKVTDVILR